MHYPLYQCAADVRAVLDTHFESEQEAADTLEAVIGQFEVKAQSVIAYRLNMQAAAGIQKIEAADGTFKAGFRKSTAIDIFDEAQIPAEFMVEKISRAPDKTAIKAAIAAGREVAGARQITRQNLQIK